MVIACGQRPAVPVSAGELTVASPQHAGARVCKVLVANKVDLAAERVCTRGNVCGVIGRVHVACCAFFHSNRSLMLMRVYMQAHTHVFM